MRVFRTKLGLWCALLALAAQVAVSFGHVHWHRLASLGALIAEAPALVDSQGAPALPPALVVDSCAACTLAGFGGNPPSAPALSLPKVALAIFAVSVDSPPRLEPHRLFQSRAPPRA